MKKNSLARMIGQISQKQPLLSNVTFDHDLVYMGPIEIESAINKVDIRVPVNCWLVMSLPESDRLIALPPGLHDISVFPWGRYQSYLVSQQTHLLLFDNLVFLTADGWNVTLNVSLAWHVQNPRRVIKLNSPAEMLKRLALTAIATTVQKHLHEDLVGIMYPPKLLANELAKEIHAQIVPGYADYADRASQNLRAIDLYGMFVDQVSVCSIQGDERLVNPQLTASAARNTLTSSLDTIAVRCEYDQKEALSRLQKAEIDQQIQQVESQSLLIEQEVEFRRNLALKLASLLPELLKNASQGIAGTSMYVPQNTAILEATLKRIETLMQPLQVNGVQGTEYKQAFGAKGRNNIVKPSNYIGAD